MVALASHNEAAAAKAAANGKKPNILVIIGDDVGIWNISAYHRGMMGGTHAEHRSDRQGRRAVHRLLRAAILHRRAGRVHHWARHPFRTGLLKVGLPGRQAGIAGQGPDHRRAAQAEGYATAQIGKNHLGDRNEYLPTVHGFDEFYGNLYHLNSEEEPEDPDYPKDPKFHAMFGPRGVLDCKATDKDDPTEDPRFGRVGKQTIKDTGPLTRKRMETAEEELLRHSLDFMDRSRQGQQAVLPLAQHDAHARLDPPFAQVGRTRAATASTPTA